MKPIHIIILFLFLPALVAAQLEGEYCYYSTEFMGGHQCITFKDNNHFHYETTDCTGGVVGNGTWELHNHELTLLFDEDKTGNIYSSTKSFPAMADVVQLQFSIRDCRSSYPLKKATIYLYDDLIPNFVDTIAFDPEHPYTCTLPKSSHYMTLQISYGKFEPFKQRFKPDKNYSFDVCFRESRARIVYDTKWVWDILYVEDGPFLLMKWNETSECMKFKKM